MSAAEMSAAMKRIVAKRMAEMNAGVEKDFAQWLAARRLAQKSGMSPGHGGAAGTGAVAGEKILSHGRLRFRPGFEDVWLGNTHHDLREWKKARLCLQYLVEKRSFDAASARHFLEEIDPHVRKQGDYLRSAEIKIDHYFNDRSGRLRMLRKDLIQAAGRSGRYFLKVE